MDEYKSIKATIEFSLPEHQNEYKMMMNAKELFGALWEIYNTCRDVYKYGVREEETRVQFAERIATLASDAGIFDYE